MGRKRMKSCMHTRKFFLNQLFTPGLHGKYFRNLSKHIFLLHSINTMKNTDNASSFTCKVGILKLGQSEL